MFFSALAGLVLNLLFATVLIAQTEPSDRQLVIWASEPAGQNWDAAYPVGNGRLGAMPFGNFPEERVLINEETIWARSEKVPVPEDSIVGLNRMVELEAAGDYEAVDAIFMRDIFRPSGRPNAHRPDSYQLLGWLGVRYAGVAELKESYRSLDLKTGIARSIHTLDDDTIVTQSVFASESDDVIIMSITSTNPLTVQISLDDSTIEGGDLVKSTAAEGVAATAFVSRVRALPA